MSFSRLSTFKLSDEGHLNFWTITKPRGFCEFSMIKHTHTDIVEVPYINLAADVCLLVPLEGMTELKGSDRMVWML